MYLTVEIFGDVTTCLVVNTGVPPYSLIQYPQFQLSAVYRGPKINLKIKEINGS
jgi:hypothetical protein